MLINNWIDFDFDNKLCSLDMSKLNTNLDKEAAIDYNISCIQNKYENFYIALSGGIDSEFIVNCFLKRGIKFTPLIVDYIANSAEIWWAYRWCYENNIKPDVIRLHGDDFIRLSSKYAIEYKTTFLSAIEHIMEKYVSSRNGSLITGTLHTFDKIDCFSDVLQIHNNDKCLLYFQSFSLMINYFIPDHPYSFLGYTPEILYSFVKGVNHSKPLALSIAEYYGVSPRPKIPSYLNTIMLGVNILNEIRNINAQLINYKIYLGERDIFLNNCESNNNISCEFVLNNSIKMPEKYLTYTKMI